VSDQLDYILRVLRLFQKIDTGGLLWHVDGDQVRFSADCSDCFAWASADAEPVDPGDLDDLGRAYKDLHSLPGGEEIWTTELYAARKRGERPMPRFMQEVPEAVRPLFEAAGPPRESTIWAP
jgi:hypothetical protein